MPDPKYVSLYEVTELQIKILKFIDDWVHEEKTPIPQSEIIKNLRDQGVKDYTTLNSINSLLRMGYIRRAIMISNKSYYVQLKRI